MVRAKRLFVSLDLPIAVAELLVRLNPGVPGVRWLGADQVHLTLAFLGNVAAEVEEKLCANLGAIQFTSFFLPLHGVGSFPARGRPKVIWIGVGRGHPHLFQLHKHRGRRAGRRHRAIPAGVRTSHWRVAKGPRVDTSLSPRGGHFDAGLVPINSFS